MYGTREVLCNELESMFSPDEPLTLLIWTGGSVEAFCEEYKPDEEEIQHVLRTIGSIDMAEYQAVGVEMGRVQEILVQHREARNRKVTVPAVVLERILERSEREFRKQDQAAANAGYDTPVSVTRSLEDIYAMKLLLLAA